MAELRISRQAEHDLMNIDEFTAGTWGDSQADLYLSKLSDHLSLLAQMPLMGRKWNYSERGLRRSEHGQHVIFYRQIPQGILVSRILHRSELPAGRVR